MRRLDKVLPRTHNIYLFGDTHEGTIYKHRKGLRRMIQRLADDPIGYGVHMGDLAEAIEVTDRRYCLQTVDPISPTPLRQYKASIEELLPIADKLLVILEGNHDFKLVSRYGSSIQELVCPALAGNRDPLSIYGTYTCRLSIYDKKGLMYKLLLFHGSGMNKSHADNVARRNLNMKLGLQRKLSPLAGDCLVMAMGHTHKLLVKEPEPELYLTDSGKGIEEAHTGSLQTAPYIPPDLRWYVNTGCFYKLYEEGVSGYAERAGYPPNELGYAVIRVKNGIVKDVERVTL